MQTENHPSKPETELKQETGEGCSGATCYALRLFTYDYYEWEEVHAVSFDPELLHAHFEGLDHFYANRPLVDGSEHSAHADREDAHWTIEPVTFLHNAYSGDPDQHNQQR